MSTASRAPPSPFTLVSGDETDGNTRSTASKRTGFGLFPGGVGNTQQDPDRFDSLYAGVVDKIFGRFPDATWVYPGHGSETTLGGERPHLAEWRERGW